jgi:hypothetical protein
MNSRDLENDFRGVIDAQANAYTMLKTIFDNTSDEAFKEILNNNETYAVLHIFNSKEVAREIRADLTPSGIANAKNALLKILTNYDAPMSATIAELEHYRVLTEARMKKLFSALNAVPYNARLNAFQIIDRQEYADKIKQNIEFIPIIPQAVDEWALANFNESEKLQEFRDAMIYDLQNRHANYYQKQESQMYQDKYRGTVSTQPLMNEGISLDVDFSTQMTSPERNSLIQSKIDEIMQSLTIPQDLNAYEIKAKVKRYLENQIDSRKGRSIEQIYVTSSSLESNGFYLIRYSQIVSIFGSAISSYALSLWVFDKTHDSMKLFYMTMASFARQIYMSIFSVLIVDRIKRKNILIIF